MPEDQAKAMAEAQRDIFAEVLDTSLATKTDIFAVRQDMADLKAEMKILKWMMGLLLGGIVALILKSFFPI